MGLKVSNSPTWVVSKEEQFSDQSLIVSSTTNYDRFNFDPTNRPVDQKHVEELIEAISEKNLLREYPIVVDVNFRIIDGQHRLRAAQTLNVPLFFIVSKDMTAKDVAAANKHQKEWATENYMHHWCAQGKPHYLVLKEFKATYPFLSISICRFLLSGHVQRRGDSFDRGDFVVSRPEFAKQVAKCLIDFSRYTKMHTRFQFVDAVASMVAHPKYSQKRMMTKLDYLSGQLRRCVDAAEYLTMLGQIYNYKVQESEKVTFKSIAQREKKPVAKE